jgi:signal transduction histidine kinase
MLLTFVLLITFNFILPAFFDNPSFIPLGSVFLFPFVIFTAYAIFKHHLLNIKVIATEILTFVLAVVSFFEVIIADNPLILIFRSGILVLILSFGVLLIRSVRKEVEQREKLEQLNKELEVAKGKLEELSRFKTQLLSLASHQIKSPLAAIKGFISIMLQGLYGPLEPKIRDTLEKMKRSSDELIDLINSVLDLRKVEEGRMEYQFEKTSLAAMTKGVVEEIQPLASAKGLKLECNLPAQEIFVQADKTKLKQVVQNLIDNSIKYTPEGFVRVELKEEDASSGGKAVILSVKDSGLGMSPELIPHLFSEFVRDERVKKEIRGTGFGLYMAKNIIEAHGGKLWAESPGEGKGSTFSVRLKEVSSAG